MFKLPITATPNQTLSYPLGGRRWEIELIKGTSNTVLVSVSVDNEVLLTNLSVVPGADILFTPDLARYGQLWFACEDPGDEVLDWTRFGTTHNLYWDER